MPKLPSTRCLVEHPGRPDSAFVTSFAKELAKLAPSLASPDAAEQVTRALEGPSGRGKGISLVNVQPGKVTNGFRGAVRFAVLFQLVFYSLSALVFLWLIEGSIYKGPLGNLRLPYWVYGGLFTSHGCLTLLTPGYIIDKRLRCPICGEPIADWYKPVLRAKVVWRARVSCQKCRLDFSKHDGASGLQN